MATIKKLNPDNAVSNKAVKTTAASKNIAAGAGLVAKQTTAAARYNVNQQKLDSQNAGGAVNAPRTPNAPNVSEMLRMVVGVGNDSKGKFGVDPVGLAMALPVGKLAKVIAPLWDAGRAVDALGISARLGAKTIGKTAAKNISVARGLANSSSNNGAFPIGPVARMLPTMLKDEAKASGAVIRAASKNVFPRAPKLGR
jgi:hypothetical protein